MRSTFDELERELDELRALVASIKPVNAVLAGHEDSLVRQYVVIRRRFDYAAFAVALYASFERFIENLVISYARLEARRLPYAALPEKLVKRHLFRTAELLLRGRLGEGRYTGLSDLGLVKNLFECLNGATPYSLNEAAVAAHDSNLRPPQIDELFATVGIEQVCDRVRRTDALVAWYCAAKGLGSPPQDGVPAVIVEERLKDIVERRNQVAHGGGNPADLLGTDDMSEALAFLEAFSRSVFSLAIARYLQEHRAASGIELRQRDGDGPYMDGTVVVVHKPPHRLFVGQPVFVVAGSAGARWGRIQSIQIDDAGVEAVEAEAPAAKGIGIGLDFKCPIGSTLVALAAEDDVAWSTTAVAAAPAA